MPADLSKYSNEELMQIAKMSNYSDKELMDIAAPKPTPFLRNPIAYATETAKGLSTGINQGLSLGFSDEIAGLSAATLDTIFGREKQGKTFGERYKNYRSIARGEEAEATAKAPIASLAGNIAGGLALPPIGKAPSLAKMAASSAGIGSIANLGMSEADLTKGEVPLGEMTAGALVGGAAPYAIKGAGTVIKKVGGKAGQILFGIKPETIAKYKARANEIRNVDEEVLKDKIDTAIKGLDSLLSDKSTKLSEDITSATKALRREISEQSSKAFESLYGMPEVSIKKAKGLLTTKLDELKVGDIEPILNSKSDFNKLTTIREYFDSIAPQGKIRPENVKQLIQTIDNELDSVFDKISRREYVSRGDRFLIDVRKKLNEELLSNPEYAQIMAPLRGDTELLEKTLGVIKRADNPEKYIARILKNGTAQDKKVLSDFISRVKKIEGQGLYDSFEAYKKVADDLKSIGSLKPTSSQSYIRGTFQRRGNIEKTRSLENLGKIAGEDFVQSAKDLGIKFALESPYTHGSRNVNLGGLSVSGVLGAMGANMPAGLAAGAIAGAINDVMGPAMYRRFIDMTMSPRFISYKGMFEAAMRQSPKAVAMLHASLLNRDMAYKNIFNNPQGNNRGLQLPGGKP